MRAKSRLIRRMVAVSALCVSLVTFMWPSVLGATVDNTSRGSASASASSLAGVNVFGWGFDEPWAIAADGSNVWVLNRGRTITEVAAAPVP